jgi:predicted trehalose synthase
MNRKTASQITDDELTELYDHADELAATVRQILAELADCRGWTKAFTLAATERNTERRLERLREHLDSLTAIDPITGATRG